MLTSKFCCRKSTAMACTGHAMISLRNDMVHGERRAVYQSTDLCLKCTAPFLSHLGKLLKSSVPCLSLTIKWKK